MPEPTRAGDPSDAGATAAGAPPEGGTAPPAGGDHPHSLGRRLAISAVLVSAVLSILFRAPLAYFVLTVMCFTGAALFEFFTVVRNRGILIHRPLGVILGLILSGLIAWRAFVKPGLLEVPAWLAAAGPLMAWGWLVFWPGAIILICIRQLGRENNSEAVHGISTTLFGLAYIATLFSYLYYLRALHPVYGAWLVFYILWVTKLADAGAYIIGKLFGRTLLIPRISPRKTREGMLGALLFAAVAALIARPVLGPFAWSPLATVLIGAGLGALGQVGDLSESLLKRDARVKDSGGLFPGLGGVLDVLDSLLFTVPVFYGLLLLG